jgi:hypothetical protein
MSPVNKPAAPARPHELPSPQPRAPRRGLVLKGLLTIAALGALAALAIAANEAFSKRPPSHPGLADITIVPTPITPPATSDLAPTSPFCDRYLRMYCDHDFDDGAHLAEYSFEDLPGEEQLRVRHDCERAAAAASPSDLLAMSACLDCAGDCGSVIQCLTGDQLCKDREGLFE